MPHELHFHRTHYVSRVDQRVDEIDSFVSAVLATIDVEAARSSPAQWEQVCRFFAGCAQAAKAQGNTPRSGGKRIAQRLSQSFPTTADPSQSGFFEFMDWLNNPAAFRPTSLRSSLALLHP